MTRSARTGRLPGRTLCAVAVALAIFLTTACGGGADPDSTPTASGESIAGDDASGGTADAAPEVAATEVPALSEAATEAPTDVPVPTSEPEPTSDAEEVTALAGADSEPEQSRDEFLERAAAAISNISDTAPDQANIDCLADSASATNDFDLLTEVSLLPEGGGMSPPASELFASCYLADDPAQRAADNAAAEDVDISDTTISCWRGAFSATDIADTVAANFRADAFDAVGEGPLFSEIVGCLTADELAALSGGTTTTDADPGPANVEAAFAEIGVNLTAAEIACIEADLASGALTAGDLASFAAVNARTCLTDDSILGILQSASPLLDIEASEARCTIDGVATGAFDPDVVDASILAGAGTCLGSESRQRIASAELGRPVTVDEGECYAEAALTADRLQETARCGLLGDGIAPNLPATIVVTPELVACLNSAGRASPPSTDAAVGALLTECLG